MHRYVVLRVKTKSRAKYTTTSGVATGFFALVFVTGNISSRLSAIRQAYGVATGFFCTRFCYRKHF